MKEANLKRVHTNCKHKTALKIVYLKEEEMGRRFETKEDIRTDNRHVKGHSTSYVILANCKLKQRVHTYQAGENSEH